MKAVLCFALLALALGACKPGTAQAARFNHIAFTVKSLPRSLSFYQQVLLLDTIPEPFHDGKHAWLAISEQGALHLIEGTRIPASVKDSHLCFSVASLEPVMASLRRMRIPFESWTGQPNQPTLRADGVKQIYFQDPDGYWLEVNDAAGK